MTDHLTYAPARCDSTVCLLGTDTRIVCQLAHGHPGQHEADQSGGHTVTWTDTTELTELTATLEATAADATGVAHPGDIPNRLIL